MGMGMQNSLVRQWQRASGYCGSIMFGNQDCCLVCRFAALFVVALFNEVSKTVRI